MQFKEQLNLLMEKIYTTKPHYIRCLKPNDENLSDRLNRPRLAEQLRYGGVLEAVRVARSGFPVRLSHSDFCSRYRQICNPTSGDLSSLPLTLTSALNDAKTFCEKLLNLILQFYPFEETKMNERQLSNYKEWRGAIDIPSQSIQLGISKVFFRKEAHDILESRRSRRIIFSVKLIQQVWKSRIIRSIFLSKLWGIKTIQRYYRGFIARKKLLIIRRNSAAVKIQALYRKSSAVYKYCLFMSSLVLLQNSCRRKRSYKVYIKLKQDKAVIQLQRFFRMGPVYLRFKRLRRAVIAIQCSSRRGHAKNILKAYRLEAKDIGKLKQSNEALKAEIEFLREHSLKVKAETQVKLEHQAVVEKNQIIEKLESELTAMQEKLKSVEEELSNARLEIRELSSKQTNVAKPEIKDASSTQKLKIQEEELKKYRDDFVKVYSCFEVFHNDAIDSVPSLLKHIKTIEAQYLALQYQNMSRVMSNEYSTQDSMDLIAANKAVIADLQLEIEKLRSQNEELNLQLQERPFLEVRMLSEDLAAECNILTIYCIF